VKNSHNASPSSADPVAPRLLGRVALVTGGGSGIGRAVCERLAAEGARVAVADIALAAAAATADAIAARGASARAVAMDVTDLERVNAGVAEIRAAWGPVDVLVNCAGWDRMEPFRHNAPELWSTLIDINLRGPIHCCRAVLDDMIAGERGKIISISSDAARVGSSGEAVYSACKGAVISFSKTLARELARHRINVNVICPGPTDTPLLRGMVETGNEKLVAALTRAIPFGRLAAPAEIAAAVAFFASPDADFITGQVLSVSGGLTMAG
jgi:2-hydroxycyclohexanecarboxyl-CoA dehydrogenase